VRIFIIPGTFDGSNLGDTAMAEIAIERLKVLWPQARFSVMTRVPAFSKKLCPVAKAISFNGCKFWTQRQSGSWKRWFPPRSLRARNFASALLESDLVVLAGSGILTDAFEATSLRILATLRAAVDQGIPTAILGQGIGPITRPRLLAAAMGVFPLIDSVLVREAGASLSLVREWKVPDERISVTGDDAVELSWRKRTVTPGNGIGLNLRVAKYGGAETQTLVTVRDVLQREAAKRDSTLIGIPIANGLRDSDLRTLRFLLPEGADSDCVPWTTENVIGRVSRCRIVVTGSYHAGVFALAQGIPVVAVVQSEYYARKFHGLAGQFAGGCTVIAADGAQFADQLSRAVDQAWNAGAELKPRLLAAAEQQIAIGHRAYLQMAEICSDRLRKIRPLSKHRYSSAQPFPGFGTVQL